MSTITQRYTMNDFLIEPACDMQLDPGIKPYVIALREGGIETFESCEGGEGHACPEPIVRFHGAAHGAGFKAFAVAQECGLPVLSLRLAYGVDGGVLTGPYWEMTFRNKARG